MSFATKIGLDAVAQMDFSNLTEIMGQPMYTVSVDIGGTFTDVVVFDEANGRTVVGKSLTTPGDLRKGVIDGLKQTADDLDVPLNSLLAEAHRFVHATTQSSNAIFAFAGAKTAVVTTRGFGDTLTIMRATGRVAGLSVFERYHYRATVKPRMLADERDIFEVAERMDYAGRPVTKLDEKALRDIAKTIKARGYQAVAVAFLFSHKSAVHEKRAKEILKEELPNVYVSLSSEVAPVLGEYERSATALFNAYVGPVIEDYLENLVTELVQRRPQMPAAHCASEWRPCNAGTDDSDFHRRIRAGSRRCRQRLSRQSTGRAECDRH